LDTKF